MIFVLQHHHKANAVLDVGGDSTACCGSSNLPLTSSVIQILQISWPFPSISWLPPHLIYWRPIPVYLAPSPAVSPRGSVPYPGNIISVGLFKSRFILSFHSGLFVVVQESHSSRVPFSLHKIESSKTLTTPPMPVSARTLSRMKVLAAGASVLYLQVHFTCAAHLELQPNVQERFSCKEFDPHIPRGTGWLLDDCLALRDSWNRTLNRGDAEARYSHPQFFHDQADVSTWILAEEMGCTVLDSSSRHTSLTDGKLYCHSTVRDAVDNPLGTKPNDVTSHCTVTNWFAYFNLKEVAANEVAVDLAEEATTNTITVSRSMLRLSYTRSASIAKENNLVHHTHLLFLKRAGGSVLSVGWRSTDDFHVLARSGFARTAYNHECDEVEHLSTVIDACWVNGWVLGHIGLCCYHPSRKSPDVSICTMSARRDLPVSEARVRAAQSSDGP